MKKCTSYLACMSVVIASLAASNSVDAWSFSPFKKSKSRGAEEERQQIEADDVGKKKHKVIFRSNKKDVADKKDSDAFDALQVIADTKIDKGLEKLLKSRDKIDQEIMKKFGELDVEEYRFVDGLLEDLAVDCVGAIAIANDVNDVNEKITCMNYITTLYRFAQNKKWNEFKHGLTEFGNITFVNRNLNNLKNNILLGIKDLFIKYFSHNEMNASSVAHVKSQQKILAIEDNVDSEANTDISGMLESLTDGASVNKRASRPTRLKRTVANGTHVKSPPKILSIEDEKDNIDSSIMLDDTISDTVRKSHRHTFKDMQEHTKQMRSGKRNGSVQIGSYRNKNIGQAITLDNFLNDDVENVDGPFTAEHVESPQATYNISGEKEQIAQVQTDVENVDGPFFVETINKSNPEYLVEELPVRNESSANDSGEGMDVKQIIDKFSSMEVANPTNLSSPRKMKVDNLTN